jgi:hypothetical protein
MNNKFSFIEAVNDILKYCLNTFNALESCIQVMKSTDYNKAINKFDSFEWNAVYLNQLLEKAVKGTGFITQYV